MAVATGLKDKLKIRNRVTFTTTGNYVMGDEGYLIVKKASGAATQVTLVKAPEDGDFVFIKDGKGDAATNNITIIPDSVSVTTIDGGASYVISENFGAVCLSYNGSEWQVEGAFKESVSQGSQTITNGTVTTLTSTNATITTLNATTLNVAGLTTETDSASVNAAGTVIGNATAITHAINIVAAANDAAGVVLPAGVLGQHLNVFNNDTNGTHGLKIYPPVNGAINNVAVNTAIIIEGKTWAQFLGINATAWGALYTVNA